MAAILQVAFDLPEPIMRSSVVNGLRSRFPFRRCEVLYHEDKIAVPAPTLNDTVDCAPMDQGAPEPLSPDVPTQLCNLPTAGEPCEEGACGPRADAAAAMAPQHKEFGDHAYTRARKARALTNECEARQAAVRADDKVVRTTPRPEAAVPAPAAERRLDTPALADEVVDIELYQAAY